MTAPVVEKKNRILETHGDKREDPYYWLNDVSDPKVIEYLKEENNYLKRSLSHTKSFQDQLFQELKSRIKEDDGSSPMKEGDFWYYYRYAKGQQYPIYCRKFKDLNGAEEIILDHNEVARGKDYCDIGFISNSPDHRYLAYSVDEQGDERYKLYIKELSSGKLSKIDREDIASSFEWLYDSKRFLFTCLDENHRPRFVFEGCIDLHESPKLIFQENDPGFFISLDSSEDEVYKFICLHGNNMSEVHGAENKDNLSFRLIAKRQANHEYDVSHLDGKFLILSNYQAENFGFYTCPLTGGEPSTWDLWRPYQPTILSEDFYLYKDYIVIQEREKALPRLRIICKKSGEEEFIDYADIPCELDVIPSREYDSAILRYVYSSLASPASTFDYNFDSGVKKVVKVQEIPDPSFNPRNYETKRIYIQADDGSEVPVSLIHRKGILLDGSHPLVLYAYGSYGSIIEAGFSSPKFSYIDRGFVYAIAHVRGGMELGRHWYLNGKLMHKKNSFLDYINVAEGLIHLGYTSKGNIIAKGGSAGGLLMGVIANWRPDLFRGILAYVPFVDALTTMLDESLPLTTIEYNEWGNPTDKTFYDYIKQYSPYDNVSEQDYPSILVICGLNDTRVTYWEPAKWVAKLRDLKTDKNPLYLKTDMGAGHAGSSGRYDYLKDLALELAFVMDKAFALSV